MEKTFFARVIVGSLFAAVAAGTWDVWWHGALGRESFWSPPHLLLYTAVIVGISTGWYVWRLSRERVWRTVALVLLLIPLSAPVDELWHRMFGVENIASPAIVWSPPHLLLIFGIISSLFALLPLLRRDERDAARLFGSMAFGVIIVLLFFVAGPVEPTGPHHLFGFWGAGVMAAVLAGVFVFAREWMPGLGGAFMSSVFFVLLNSVQFGEKIATSVTVPPHDHAPSWLLVFAVLVPAALLDLIGRRLPLWAQGGLVGFLWSFLLYGFASYFFEPQFQYTIVDALTAIGASTLGGVAAGSVISFIYKTKLTTSALSHHK